MYSHPMTGILAFASGSKSARQTGSRPAAGRAGEAGAASRASVAGRGNRLAPASAPVENRAVLLVKGTQTSGNDFEAWVIVWFARGKKKFVHPEGARV